MCADLRTSTPTGGRAKEWNENMLIYKNWYWNDSYIEKHGKLNNVYGAVCLHNQKDEYKLWNGNQIKLVLFCCHLPHSFIRSCIHSFIPSFLHSFAALIYHVGWGLLGLAWLLSFSSLAITCRWLYFFMLFNIYLDEYGFFSSKCQHINAYFSSNMVKCGMEWVCKCVHTVRIK